MPVIFSQHLTDNRIVGRETDRLVGLQLFVQMGRREQKRSALEYKIADTQEVIRVVTVPSEEDHRLIPVHHVLRRFDRKQVNRTVRGGSKPTFRPAAIHDIVRIEDIQQIETLACLIELPFITLLRPQAATTERLPGVVTPLDHGNIASQVATAGMRFHEIEHLMLGKQMFLAGNGITVVHIFIRPQGLFRIHMGRTVHISNSQRHIQAQRMFRISKRP